MKYILLFAFVFFLMSAHCFVFAQEDVKAKHEAYYLCINNIEKEPPKAYQYCSEYLKKYPGDDVRLVEFVQKWVSAYEKISRYLNSTQKYFAADPAQSWAIYQPDLEKQIPIVSEKEDSHKIEIARKFNSPFEDRLLSKAESVYKNPQLISQEMFRDWRFLSNGKLPDGEPKWWQGTFDTISSAEIVTTGAVLYYYSISKKLRKNPKLTESGFAFSNTDLKYESSIKKLDKYERGGKVFNNVYVADLNLTWAQICGGLCGQGFTRNKVVVLDENGNILDVFLDAAVNRVIWES